MSTKIYIPPNTTLLRLVTIHKSRFYPQDWYVDEEFANKDVSGEWIVHEDDLLPAAVWAYVYVSGFAGSYWLNYKYLWTNDTDSNGDQVYVGRADKKGFQVHRHLTIKDELFLNKREV